MALPAVPAERLAEALRRFDLELRETGEWRGWEADGAHRFAIEHQGRLYPVKMVVSLATGVPRSRFSGGRGPGQAGWYAERAGLRVVRLPGRDGDGGVVAPGRRYWAVSADPARYRVLDAARDLEATTWTTKGRPLAVGDRLALWQTRDRAGRRGIVALAEVTEPATVRPAADAAYWSDPAGTAPEERVGLRIARLPEPLWLGGQAGGVLETLSVARARGGSVFRIEPERWDALLGALGGWPGREPARLAEDVLRRDGRGGPRAQGRGLGPAERRAVELHAMRLAMEHYRPSWGEVRDVSAAACFDLLCRAADGRELHVEVKGTTGAGEAVLVTRNEVEHARRVFPAVALVVVSGILLRADEDGVPAAEGGTVAVHDPWDVSRCEMTPLAFECVIGGSVGARATTPETDGGRAHVESVVPPAPLSGMI